MKKQLFNILFAWIVIVVLNIWENEYFLNSIVLITWICAVYISFFLSDIITKGRVNYFDKIWTIIITSLILYWFAIYAGAMLYISSSFIVWSMGIVSDSSLYILDNIIFHVTMLLSLFLGVFFVILSCFCIRTAFTKDGKSDKKSEIFKNFTRWWLFFVIHFIQSALQIALFAAVFPWTWFGAIIYIPLFMTIWSLFWCIFFFPYVRIYRWKILFSYIVITTIMLLFTFIQETRNPPIYQIYEWKVDYSAIDFKVWFMRLFLQ